MCTCIGKTHILNDDTREGLTGYLNLLNWVNAHFDPEF